MTLNHVHKYIYKNIGSREKPRRVYACAHPECSHYTPNVSLVRGKKSVCWQCNEEMILTNDIVRKRIVKPRCLVCRGKEKPKEESTDRAIEMLLTMKG